MNRFPQVAGKVLLSVVLTLLFFGLLELLCRALNAGYPTRFLIPFQRHGQPVWIDNQLFGYRFFAPPVSRAPPPIVIPVQKATNEFRVVILGESAAMGEPEPVFGPARMLEMFLARRFTDRKVTVINAAMTAINSHVIREIARDLEKMQPDAVILYIGNNEVVGPFGPGTVFNEHSISPAINRVRTVASRLQISSTLKRWWSQRDNSDEQIWRGMEMFTENPVPRDDPRLSSVYESFSGNIHAIIKEVRDVGALPVLCTVAVNLAAQSPFHGGSLATDVMSIGDLKRLRDEDQLRFRADSAINQSIRDISAQHSSTIYFCDVEGIFETDGPPGNNFFLDHVHFNLSGSYVVAKAWDDAISKAFPESNSSVPTFSDISEYVIWNPYSALDIADKMKERASRPPFTFASDNTERLLKWNQEIANIHRKIRTSPIDATLQTIRDRLEEDPKNQNLLSQISSILLYDDRYSEAGNYLNQLHEVLPHRADVRGWISILAAISGERDRLWSIMTEHAPPLGQIPADLLISASETLRQGGYRAESLVPLEIAAHHFPHRTRLQLLLATRYAQVGNMYRAGQIFQELTKKHPDATWIREEYGLLQAVSGHTAEAEEMLGHLRSSTISADRIKWVKFLLFKQNIQEAEKTLTQIIDDDPTYAESYELLVQLYAQTNKIELTISLLEKWSQLQPWRGDIWGQLGSFYDLVNRASDAVTAYEKAIRLLPDPSGTMRSLAWILATEDDAAIRNPSRAKAIMNQVITLSGENDPYTLYVHAAALAANERYEDAVVDIDKGIGLLNRDTDGMLRDELIRARDLFDQGLPIKINRASAYNR